jgi:hypothetical protein
MENFDHYDGHAEYQSDYDLYECKSCINSDDKMQSAAYWLRSMLQRIEDGQGIACDDFEFDLVELCCVLGVEAPKQKINYA